MIAIARENPARVTQIAIFRIPLPAWATSLAQTAVARNACSNQTGDIIAAPFDREMLLTGMIRLATERKADHN
jgi:hypothetical protein